MELPPPSSQPARQYEEIARSELTRRRADREFPYLCFECGAEAHSRCGSCKDAVFCGERCFTTHQRICPGDDTPGTDIGRELFCFSDEYQCKPASATILRSNIDPIPLRNIRDNLDDPKSSFSRRFMVSLATITDRQLRLFTRLAAQLENEKTIFAQRFHKSTGVKWTDATDTQKDRHSESHAALVAKASAMNSVVGTLSAIDAPDPSRLDNIRMRSPFGQAFEDRRLGLINVIDAIDNLIGLQTVKDNIGAIIVQFVYEPTSTGKDHLNIALGGPPGTGKSTVALMLMQVFYNLGVLPKPVAPDALVKKNGGDLVAAFEGGTAGKTNQFMTDIIGSVGFLDEAYSLAARSGDRVSYGKVAIDTIVSMLDAYIGAICLVVAGYARDLEDSFFKANVGMTRRFPMRWETEAFTPEQLTCILSNTLSERNAALTAEACRSATSIINHAHSLGVFTFSNAGGIKTIVDLCIRMDAVVRYHKNNADTDTDMDMDDPDERRITSNVFRNAMAVYIRSAMHKKVLFFETDPEEAARKQACEGCDPPVDEDAADKTKREDRCRECTFVPPLAAEEPPCEPCRRSTRKPAVRKPRYVK